MYKCKYFGMGELVPEYLYSKYRHRPDKIWELFDETALTTLDALRKRYGTTLINTWQFGGLSEYRGFRPWECNVGATLSQHKFGRAFDLTFKHADAREARRDILSLTPEQRLAAGIRIRRLETGIPWFHFDQGNTGLGPGEIFTFKP